MGIRIDPHIVVFDASGSWTVPTDVEQIEVEQWGGGGSPNFGAGGDSAVKRGATNLLLAKGGASSSTDIGAERAIGISFLDGTATGVYALSGKASGTLPGGGYDPRGSYVAAGDYVHDAISVNPGETLTIVVGAAGYGYAAHGRVVIRYWTHVFG